MWRGLDVEPAPPPLKARAATAGLAIAFLCAAGAATHSVAAHQSEPIDCIGPAGDPPPGAEAWNQRERETDYCVERRADDTSISPLCPSASAALEASSGGTVQEAPFRDPAQWN